MPLWQAAPVSPVPAIVRLLLDDIDVDEEGVIDQSASLSAVPREPDAVTWIGTEYFATADEGDLDGGSRGFTIFISKSRIRIIF